MKAACAIGAIALSLLAGCGASPPAPCAAPAPCPPTAPCPTPVATTSVSASPARAADPLLQRLVEALNSLPPGEDWVMREVHVFPGHFAAVAVADHVEHLADCNKSQPLLLLGRNKLLKASATSGLGLIRAQDGTVFWDLRGDGARFLVVEEHLCNFATSTQVYWLDRQDEWQLLEGEARPSCVLCPRPKEKSADGKPMFSVPFLSLTLASGGPYFPTAAVVDLVEAWDGTRFSRDLPGFAPLYQQRLASARAAGRKARARGSARCNVEAFQSAGEIFVYSIMLGADPSAALAEAERVVAGISTKACQANHAESIYGSQSFPWSSIREELQARAADVPVLRK